MLIDDGGDELVSIPSSIVQGLKTKPDGDILFKMVGGPYHNMTLRVGAPFDRVVFKVRGQIIVYRLRPPHNSKDKWVYGYDALDETDYTLQERGYDRSNTQTKWVRAEKFLVQQKEDQLRRAAKRLKDRGFEGESNDD